MGFADSVAATADKMLSEVNAKGIKIAIELFNETVTQTPINKLMVWRGKASNAGELINNWYVGQGVGAYNKSYSYAIADITGSGSYSRIAAISDSKEFSGKDGEISLTNSTPYAMRAEYIGWPAPNWSGAQGPYAMVRNSLTKVSAKYKGR